MTPLTTPRRMNVSGQRSGGDSDGEQETVGPGVGGLGPGNAVGAYWKAEGMPKAHGRNAEGRYRAPRGAEGMPRAHGRSAEGRCRTLMDATGR